MIETLVMPLPSEPTDATYDIAVVLGQLSHDHLVLSHDHLVLSHDHHVLSPVINRWTVVSICILLDYSCELSSLPCYRVLCHVIITLLLCNMSSHYPVTGNSVMME